jgi:hypothetical protein
MLLGDSGKITQNLIREDLATILLSTRICFADKLIRGELGRKLQPDLWVVSGGPMLHPNR